MLSLVGSRPLKASFAIRFRSRALSSKPPAFQFEPLFQSNIYKNGPQEWKQILPKEAVRTVQVNGQEFLSVPGDAMRVLSKHAFADIAHLLRPAHLQQLRNILDDPDASANDNFVAMELLKNASIASARVLPGCQDTGTAIVMGKRGHRVLTDGNDEEYLAGGAYDAYTELNLRYSQVAPLDMFTEKNTGTNLPAQVDLYASSGDEYKFMFIAKGGGSANKTFFVPTNQGLVEHRVTRSLFGRKDQDDWNVGLSSLPFGYCDRRLVC